MANEQVIWTWGMEKFGNPYGVAGLMGNLYAESGLNPQNLQNTYEKKLGMTDAEYTQQVDNGTYTNFVHDSAGYGLAQWTYWSRKQNLLNFAKSKNKSIGDLQMQLDFLYQELTTGYPQVVQILKTSKSVLECSNEVLLKFERPANQSEERQKTRASYGQTFFDKYANTKGVTSMSNSPLVDYVKLSPNHSGQRTHAVDRITPHCVVGQCSVETLGNVFAPTSKQASCQYGIGVDGRVGMYCEEKNRSWCSSSNANDQRAITIECASDTTAPYAFKDVVYNKLIDLCVDICQRYGKTKLLWFGDKDKTLNYNPASDEMVLTVHRWFAAKSCPGDWMYARMGDLATKVTARLGGATTTTPQTPTNVSYQCKVTANDGLNCRTSATVSSAIVKTYPLNTVLTISKEQNNWGYTGEGWVSLAYVSKINSSVIVPEEEDEMTQEKFNQMMDNYLKDLASKDTTWAQNYLDWAKANKIMVGDKKGRMMPLKFCTRQEVVVMLKRIYDLLAK